MSVSRTIGVLSSDEQVVVTVTRQGCVQLLLRREFSEGESGYPFRTGGVK